MTRELRIGDRVKTPDGEGIVIGFGRGHAGEHVELHDGTKSWLVYEDGLAPLPRDIPRHLVEERLAAVERRMERLREEHFTDGRWVDWEMGLIHDELAEVAASLTEMLGGPRDAQVGASPCQREGACDAAPACRCCQPGESLSTELARLRRDIEAFRDAMRAPCRGPRIANRDYVAQRIDAILEGSKP